MAGDLNGIDLEEDLHLRMIMTKVGKRDFSSGNRNLSGEKCPSFVEFFNRHLFQSPHQFVPKISCFGVFF